MPEVTSRPPIGEWPGWVRGTAFGAVVLVLVLLAARVGGGVAVRRPLPDTDGTLQLAGLNDTVQGRRDEHGVPQVYAGNSGDLFYAQGFVQAQDRVFQMAFPRHVTAGRISELLGEETVETDMYIRTMGW